jgi:hypothetical protein
MVFIGWYLATATTTTTLYVISITRFRQCLDVQLSERVVSDGAVYSRLLAGDFTAEQAVRVQIHAV